MWIESLALKGFRNYDEARLKLSPCVNIFIGGNGMGKTNLLEAIYVLSQGRSYRGKDADLIRWQNKFLRIGAGFHSEDSGRRHVLEYYLDQQGRTDLKLNQVPTKNFKDLERRIHTVLFTPDDLSVVKGGPVKRRAFLDGDLEAFAPDYETLIRSYRRVLSQRNELLKDIRAGRSDVKALEPWTEQLVRLGSAVILSRLAFLARLVPQARRLHHYITGSQGGFDVRYQSLLGQVLHMDAEELEVHFRSTLDQAREDEIRRGSSLFGPQRDDLVFYQDAVDLRRYGSQGQQRTAILVMKMAEVSLYQRQFGLKPILLLDDVFSELDPERQAALVEIICAEKIQTIITGTNVDVGDENWENMSLFHIHEGQIIQNPHQSA